MPGLYSWLGAFFGESRREPPRDNLDKRSPGNFRKATPEYEKILLETIDKDPEEYGYEFGRWTAARLATYLEKVTGIKLSGSQIARILHKKNTFTFGQNTA